MKLEWRLLEWNRNEDCWIETGMKTAGMKPEWRLLEWNWNKDCWNETGMKTVGMKLEWKRNETGMKTTGMKTAGMKLEWNQNETGMKTARMKPEWRLLEWNWNEDCWNETGMKTAGVFSLKRRKKYSGVIITMSMLLWSFSSCPHNKMQNCFYSNKWTLMYFENNDNTPVLHNYYTVVPWELFQVVMEYWHSISFLAREPSLRAFIGCLAGTT